MEGHYRWHPFYGRRLLVEYIEQRAGGSIVHVEIEPSVVTILPEWMFDAGICSSMTFLLSGLYVFTRGPLPLVVPAGVEFVNEQSKSSRTACGGKREKTSG